MLTHLNPLAAQLCSLLAENDLVSFRTTLAGAQAYIGQAHVPERQDAVAQVTLDAAHQGRLGPVAVTPWDTDDTWSSLTRHTSIITLIDFHFHAQTWGSDTPRQCRQLAVGYFLASGLPRSVGTLAAIELMIRLKFPAEN
ncbi:hypothetical protein [Deinococcus ficus]|uniref:Uncharacterized protein n=1 Tax=Deinococcus ficus TaxID=317577 RepID=A0A221T2Z7_9DEIO|nr:hypothetical protein [Deinococcus ficus]ASN83269.1 hypothetical protein DFI_18905 [Deinococcus ficus]